MALGFAYYVKFVFKRPPITEEGERTRIEAEATKLPLVMDPTVAGLFFKIEPFTVNISSPEENGKLRYVVIELALEARDGNALAKAEEARPVLTDRIIHQLGKKTFEQLTEVQGRFVLRSEIMELANEALAETAITNVYIMQLTAQ